MPHPLPLYSQRYTFSAGGNQPIPLDFLEPAMNGFKNPVIRQLRLFLGITCTTGAGGGPARAMPTIIDRIHLTDGATDRVNAKGSSARIFNHAEFTGRYTDGKDLDVNLGATTFEHWLDLLPCYVENEQSEDDHGILVSDLLNGGRCSITWGQATPIATYQTFTSASYVELHAEVFEAKPGKLYPRHCWSDVNMQSNDFRYAFNMRGRWYSGYTAQGDNVARAGWSAQDLTSRNLDINTLRQSKFADDYKKRGNPARVSPAEFASTVATEDPFLRANPEAVALLMPQDGQKISELPVLDSIQWKTSLASIGASDPQIIMSGYTNRSPELEAAALGVDVATAQASLRAGTIADSSRMAGGAGTLGRQLPVVARRVK